MAAVFLAGGPRTQISNGYSVNAPNAGDVATAKTALGVSGGTDYSVVVCTGRYKAGSFDPDADWTLIGSINGSDPSGTGMLIHVFMKVYNGQAFNGYLQFGSMSPAIAQHLVINISGSSPEVKLMGTVSVNQAATEPINLGFKEVRPGTALLWAGLWVEPTSVITNEYIWGDEAVAPNAYRELVSNEGTVWQNGTIGGTNNYTKVHTWTIGYPDNTQLRQLVYNNVIYTPNCGLVLAFSDQPFPGTPDGGGGSGFTINDTPPEGISATQLKRLSSLNNYTVQPYFGSSTSQTNESAVVSNLLNYDMAQNQQGGVSGEYGGAYAAQTASSVTLEGTFSVPAVVQGKTIRGFAVLIGQGAMNLSGGSTNSTLTSARISPQGTNRTKSPNVAVPLLLLQTFDAPVVSISKIGTDFTDLWGAPAGLTGDSLGASMAFSLTWTCAANDYLFVDYVDLRIYYDGGSTVVSVPTSHSEWIYQ